MKARKWLALILSVMLLSAVVPASAATAPCQHHYVKTVIDPATCTEWGLAVYTCDKCGDSYQDAIEPLIAKINELGRKVTFVGDALAVFKEKLKSSVTVPYSFAPIHLAKQSAASVGWLGLKLLAEGKTVTAEEFVPTYLRISQADREREERLEG